MASDRLKITYEDVKDRQVDDVLAQQAAVRRTQRGPKPLQLLSHVKRTWAFLAVACIAVALIGWGLVEGILWLNSPKDTFIQIGSSSYLLSREAQKYLRIAEVSPYKGTISVLIIEEPHYSPEGQFALYKGLEVFFQDNPQLLQKTAFLSEGVPAGKTLSIDSLVRANPQPDDELIATVLSSFLITGYIAYEWKHQHSIPIIGIEDENLYRLSAKLWLEAHAQDDPQKLLFWHWSIVARNTTIAQTLIDKTGRYDNPILFVGGLHLHSLPDDEFNQARTMSQEPVVSADQYYFETRDNLGVADYLSQEAISYTFLVANVPDPVAAASDMVTERYAHLFEAQ